MLPDHLHMATKLFLAAFTRITASASDEIVNTNAISRREVRSVRTNSLHAACDFVPESQR
jgi:hypothetical protein